MLNVCLTPFKEWALQQRIHSPLPMRPPFRASERTLQTECMFPMTEKIGEAKGSLQESPKPKPPRQGPNKTQSHGSTISTSSSEELAEDSSPLLTSPSVGWKGKHLRHLESAWASSS